jgi:hypothetical protein
MYICAIKQQQKFKTMSNTTSTTIEIFGHSIEAFTTLDAAWNASVPNGFWGTGSYLSNGPLWIVMSENHPVYLQILEAKNEWKLVL